MPYIKEYDRNLFSFHNLGIPENEGELNYVISKIIDKYLLSDNLSYENLNEVIGVLECCKLEVYRRIVTPYEEKKMESNGDVFECVKLI